MSYLLALPFLIGPPATLEGAGLQSSTCATFKNNPLVKPQILGPRLLLFRLYHLLSICAREQVPSICPHSKQEQQLGGIIFTCEEQENVHVPIPGANINS